MPQRPAVAVPANYRAQIGEFRHPRADEDAESVFVGCLSCEIVEHFCPAINFEGAFA
jgi:hypothetical protein